MVTLWLQHRGPSVQELTLPLLHTDNFTCAQGIRGLILVAPAVIAFGFAMPQATGKSGSAVRDVESAKVSFGPSLPPGTVRKRYILHTATHCQV